MQQHASGSLDTQLFKDLWMSQRQLYHFAHLLDLFFQAANILVRHLRNPAHRFCSDFCDAEYRLWSHESRIFGSDDGRYTCNLKCEPAAKVWNHYIVTLDKRYAFKRVCKVSFVDRRYGVYGGPHNFLGPYWLFLF